MIGFKTMKTQFDISELIKVGKIQNELDFERVLIADRKLRVISKKEPKYKTVRKELRTLIEQYENQNWSAESEISDKKIRESDVAELIAEKERLFIKQRKNLLRKKKRALLKTHFEKCPKEFKFNTTRFWKNFRPYK